jgi:hypothetical protein
VLPEETVVVPAVLLQAANSSRSSTISTDGIDIQSREYEEILRGIDMISSPRYEAIHPAGYLTRR